MTNKMTVDAGSNSGRLFVEGDIKMMGNQLGADVDTNVNVQSGPGATRRRNSHTNELFILEPGLWKAAGKEEIKATCEILQQLNLYELPYPTVTVRILGKDIMVVPKGKRPISKSTTEFFTSGIDERCSDAVGGIDADGHPTSDCLYLDVTVSTVPGSGCRIQAYNERSGFLMDVIDVEKRSQIEQAAATGASAKMENVDPRGFISLTHHIPEYRERMRKATCDFLIALLATKNIVKVRKVDKLAKLGIGRNSKRGHKHRYTYTTTLRVPRPEDCEDDTGEHKPTGKHLAPHLRRAHLRRQHYGPGNKFYKQILIPSVFVNADADFVSKREAYNVGLGRTQELEPA